MVLLLLLLLLLVKAKGEINQWPDIQHIYLVLTQICLFKKGFLEACARSCTLWSCSRREPSEWKRGGCILSFFGITIASIPIPIPIPILEFYLPAPYRPPLQCGHSVHCAPPSGTQVYPSSASSSVVWSFSVHCFTGWSEGIKFGVWGWWSSSWQANALTSAFPTTEEKERNAVFKIIKNNGRGVNWTSPKSLSLSLSLFLSLSLSLSLSLVSLYLSLSLSLSLVSLYLFLSISPFLLLCYSFFFVSHLTFISSFWTLSISAHSLTSNCSIYYHDPCRFYYHPVYIFFSPLPRLWIRSAILWWRWRWKVSGCETWLISLSIRRMTLIIN